MALVARYDPLGFEKSHFGVIRGGSRGAGTGGLAPDWRPRAVSRIDMLTLYMDLTMLSKGNPWVHSSHQIGLS